MQQVSGMRKLRLPALSLLRDSRHCAEHVTGGSAILYGANDQANTMLTLNPRGMDPSHRKGGF